MQNGHQTFLFMDLVGFTALTAEQGDENAAEVAIRFYAHVRALLPDHCGEEIKTIGDAMMVRCDEPRQAIALALRICHELGDHEVRDLVVDRRADEDHALAEEARVDVERALTACVLLNDHRDHRHCSALLVFLSIRPGLPVASGRP